MKQYKYTAVLTIAGSDSGGGAGIQADLKTFSALGCFGTSAITAITVQNTRGVFGIHSIPPATVREQIEVVMDDIHPAAIKIGMVHSAELAGAIAEALRKYRVPVILDPVMVATSGDKLIEDNTIDVLKRELFPLADLITPNLDEAQLLTGMTIQHTDDMRVAAHRLIKAGCNAVLVKGGHLRGTMVTDVYLDSAGKEKIFTSPYIVTTNTHGTGCTLSSAIAAFRARGVMWIEAITEARNYVHEALVHGKDVRTGTGSGPLNHFFNPQKMITHELE
jgi:hydroxymethylpyrimidine/phosphomethylpyrimidine kinase